MRGLWLLAGLLLGVVIGRNKGDIPAPEFVAIALCAGGAVLLAWRAGRRDIKAAVSTAVAASVAQAEATAAVELEQRLAAQAIATGGAVHVTLPGADPLFEQDRAIARPRPRLVTYESGSPQLDASSACPYPCGVEGRCMFPPHCPADTTQIAQDRAK